MGSSPSWKWTGSRRCSSFSTPFRSSLHGTSPRSIVFTVTGAGVGKRHGTESRGVGVWGDHLQTLPHLSNALSGGELSPASRNVTTKRRLSFQPWLPGYLTLPSYPLLGGVKLTLSRCPVPGNPIWRRKHGFGRQEPGGVHSSGRRGTSVPRPGDSGHLLCFGSG